MVGAADRTRRYSARSSFEGSLRRNSRAPDILGVGGERGWLVVVVAVMVGKREEGGRGKDEEDEEEADEIEDDVMEGREGV